MQIAKQHINFKNEDLVLTNHRAIYWEKENTLILSDLHIGKTAHFRKHGIPVPDDIFQKDLERLKILINHFKAKTLLIVGDLFHAEANIDFNTFKFWLAQFEDLQIHLIKGNHDRVSKHLITDFNIKLETEVKINELTFVHEHLKVHSNSFTISGHTHPGVMLKGKGKQRLKLPCYQVTKNQIVLPAFSLFTGLNTRSKPKDAISYAFTETSIFKF
ncbi:ligase-associated DNA damage response endonuclease PdeM [Winogradskyella luteola]|uniref:Ligase-associated DNA damage response endonuclease PdeM n=1 Tax=Winogradskyella luteola TaxID=2828330 RepID=A0A9X1JPT0_9FLAO|nr:ligase-associated DNA damage response endonuclease PdeM [Winogradskyella luteola]